MLIIEDGTAKVDAQSYSTAAELGVYAAARGIALPATDAEKEVLLVKAMDYMESLRYIGTPVTEFQALAWPRRNVYLNGYSISQLTIPAKLKEAQMQLALDAQTVELMGNVVPSTERAVIEERVEGAVSVKYAAPTASLGALSASFGITATGAQLTRARSLLRAFVAGLGQVRVARG